MVGIYRYENGLKFTGIIAETEEKAWTYLDEEANKRIPKFEEVWGIKAKANKDCYEIKEVTLI